jgi:glycosyltransferase involved in cell wall biosynthesis
MEAMRIALVHDYLNQLGGGERVLQHLMKMFPEAPVFTLLYDRKKTQGLFEGRVRGTSFLDFQFARDHHRLFIPLMPLAARKMDLGGEFDLIISSSAGFGKGITYDHSKTKHLCYVHTPLRYAWETDAYFGHNLRAQLFNLVFRPAFAYVRRFDYWAGQQPDVLVANSEFIARKIKQYYDREAEVVYPGADTTRFYYEAAPPREYYLAAGRLLHYKRFDLVIDAFNRLGLPLKIVGSGDRYDSLKQRITSNKIEMLGYVQGDAELRALYNGAKGFIMANEEDFGLVTAEAQACGTPVIAYSAGGSIEIVEPHATGLLFHDQTVDSLIQAVEDFERVQFDRKRISEHAQKFSMGQFEQGMSEKIQKLVEQSRAV